MLETPFYGTEPTVSARGGHSLKRDCRTGRGIRKYVTTPLIPGAVKLIGDFGGPSPSLLKPQYFGNVPLVFYAAENLQGHFVTEPP